MTKRSAVLTLLVCLTTPLFAADCEPAFADGARYHLPYAVALIAQDVNADGRPDLVGATEEATSLTVFVNTPAGFISGAPIALGHSVARLYDVNADGNAARDILAVGFNRITTLFANGNGTYRAVTSTAASLHFVSAVGEFNSDGRTDVAVIGNDRFLRIYAGNADGTFSLISTGTDLLGPRRPAYSMKAGEVTGDAHNDLVITGDFGATVYTGNGAGTFTKGRQLNQSDIAQRIAIADFDGDTRNDIVLQTRPGSGALYPGSSAATKFLTCAGTAAVADLDGDGKMDAVSDTFEVCRGNGDGTFAEPWNGATFFIDQSSFSQTVSLADFNGDARLDVAGVAGNDDVAVFFAKPGLQFTGSRDYDVSSSTVSVDAADLNGDGRDDVVTGGYSGVNVFLAGADGILTRTGTYNRNGAVAAADLNGDAKVDVFLDPTSTLVNAGDGTLQITGADNLSYSFDQIARADLNGDGKTDFVGVLQSMSNQTEGIAVMLRGSGDAYTITTYATGHKSVRGIAIGDATGDAVPDVLATGYDDNGLDFASLRMLAGRADGTLASAIVLHPDILPADVLIANIDGDAHNDLAFIARTENDGDALLVMHGAGNGTFTEQQRIALSADVPQNGFGEVRLAAGDFNGDGRIDLAVKPAEAEITQILLQDDTHHLRLAHQFLSTDAAGSPLVAGDFNNDGVDDLAILTSGTIMDVHLSACRDTFTALPTRVTITGPKQGVKAQPVTFVASVDAPSGGLVSFYSDDYSGFRARKLLGTAPLFQGRAMLKVPFASVGDRKVYAIYHGEGALAASMSNAIAYEVTASSGLPRRRAVRR